MFDRACWAVGFLLIAWLRAEASGLAQPHGALRTRTPYMPTELASPHGPLRARAAMTTAGEPCNIIHVSPTGLATNTGTRNATTTLARALVLAANDATRNVIRATSATYAITETIVWRSGLTLEGGFVVGTGGLWVKTATPSVFNIEPPVIEPNGANTLPGHYIGIQASGISNFALRDVVLRVKPTGANGTSGSAGRSVYGIYLSNADSYTLTRVAVVAGAASNGGANVAPASAVGSVGTAGAIDSGCSTNDLCPSGGAGGAGGGGAAGGAGGTLCRNVNAASSTGKPGTTATGRTGGGRFLVVARALVSSSRRVAHVAGRKPVQQQAFVALCQLKPAF
eukprot:TRINITY_DN1252_c0_g2_i1.p1 TRINITY_DN1252_c0_g2~~TRINITY_DN1252_c0_g2_i1.p1  ORF type:complete len:339 (-),score=98.98 TRINITY_DN1252_c0_g2_i1:302-1318(-)